MMGFFGLFNKKKEIAPTPQRHAPILRVRPQAINKNKVVPTNTKLHEKRGWVQKGDEYFGYYRTLYGAWAGVIVRRGDIFEPFIIDPPIRQLKRHDKWICFKKIQRNKVKIHLQTQPKDWDVGAVVLYVEGLIYQSHRLT